LKTLERVAPRPPGLDLALDPAQVAFLARKLLYEVRARHAGFLHAQLHDGALVGAHLLHQPPHGFAQRLDLLRREADLHQLVADGVARLQVRTAPRTVARQRARHLAVERPDDVEALQR